MNADSIQFVDTDETSRPEPALTGITAFMGITERGPINDPKDILYSWDDYQKIFGGLLETSDFPLICKRALDGGSPLRVSRVAHYTDITNAATLSATRPASQEIIADDGAVTPTVLGTVRPKYAGAVTPSVVFGTPSNGLGPQGYFNISVIVGGKVVEVYQNLRITGRPTIADSKWLAKLVGSNLIEFTYADLSGIAGTAPIEVVYSTINFAAGSNGGPLAVNDYVGNAGSKTGFNSFDGYDDFYQIAVPELADNDVHNAGASYTESRGDCEYWAHLSNDSITVAALIAERLQITEDTKYLSIFAGGVRFLHPISGNEVSTSELGDMAAIQAYVDKNFAPWISAANYVRGSVRSSTLGVVNNFGSKGDFPKLNQLTQNQINMMVQANNRIYMSSNVSGQYDDTKASYRNVVRGIIYIKKSIHQTLVKYLQEPPTFGTFRALFNEVEPFLDDMAARRAFASTTTYKGYKWLGDQDASSYEELTINSKSQLDLGNYRVRLELDFLGSINTITLELALVDGAASTTIIENNANL